jgi:hypothetical protein
MDIFVLLAYCKNNDKGVRISTVLGSVLNDVSCVSLPGVMHTRSQGHNHSYPVT